MAKEMPGPTDTPAAEEAATGTSPPAALFRLGIASRLLLAFLAVTVLAIAANLIAEHGTSIIETTQFRTIVAPQAPVAAPPAAHAAPVRARNAPVVVGAAAFLAALAEADRAIHARVESPGAKTDGELTTALEELTRQTTTYWQPSGAAPGDRRAKPPALLGTLRDDGAAAIRLADKRRERAAAYLAHVGTLDATMKSAIDQSWKIFGRVIARQSLIDLGRGLDALRSESSALAGASPEDGAPLVALAASEARLQATLERTQEGLKRSQGEPWVSSVQARIAALADERSALAASADELQRAAAQLAEHREAIVTLVRWRAAAALEHAAALERAAAARAIPVPAKAAPPPEPEPIVEPPVVRRVISAPPSADEVRIRQWVLWISVAVLLWMFAMSVSTILSVVRPVRRLIEATRRLSAGSTAQVPRGGIKELDVLAAAFNDMAQQLSASRDAARAHQVKLEERVQERTRALKHLAEHDALTQLPNRRRLFARLNEALAAGVISGERVGVYFLDLDNFKNVNDSMGHAFGDRVLQSVAERLQETTAAYGFAARLGGDEFTVVYPGAADTAAVVEAGQAICRAFQQPLKVGERQLNMSVSVGISIYPDHETNADALLRAADAALFRAKALGRNRLSVFSPDLVKAAVSKFSIEQGLRRAIEHDELELVYQPQVSLRSLEPTLVEALLRWRTSGGKVLCPGEFLSVAEDSGLIVEISDWALRTAIEKAATWYYGAWPNVRVAINVSPRQLRDPAFVDRVQELMAQHRLPPTCIELELTEDVLQTGAATIDALRRLRELGVAIALDDFGTGYSSLSSLELLPLTRVKLDRSLIACIDTSTGSRAIASAIIGLCASLGLEVTAEGVERTEQLEVLAANRDIQVQGFLLARPAEPDAVLAELARLPSHLRALLGMVSPAGSAAEAPERAHTGTVVRLVPR
jgi:diguanylate cyclase (GGDEF)-like protein